MHTAKGAILTRAGVLDNPRRSRSGLRQRGCKIVAFSSFLSVLKDYSKIRSYMESVSDPISFPTFAQIATLRWYLL